jgi:hypothetical protein
LTSERKIAANRANARASTGPKTRRGRSRSAKNAFRHGLSLPVESDQALFEEVEALAGQISGPHAGSHIQMLALRVADALIDLRRIRYARHQLLTRALSDPHYDNRTNVREKRKAVRGLVRPNAPEVPRAALVESVSSTPDGARKFATILSQQAGLLGAVDRYERRARSRLKFAIRAVDAAGV